MAAARRSRSSTPAPVPRDDVERAGHRIGRHRQAAGERLEQHDAEGVGEAREHEDVGGGVDPGERRAGLRAEERAAGEGAASPARAGPSPTTTLVPGRSRARKAATFFSTASRPT